MNIKNDDFVCIAKEAYLFVGHLNSSVVDLRNLLDRFFKLFRTELNLGVCNLDWRKFFRLAVQFVFRSLEIVKSVAHVASLDLLASEVLNFACSFLDIFFAKLYQTKVLLKIFLFSSNSRFFNFEGVGVLKFNFGLLKQNLSYDSFEVVIDLGHSLDFASFDIFGQIKSLIY